MRAIVVHDEMHVQVPRHGGIDRIQELPELDRTVPLTGNCVMSSLVFTLSAANNVVVP